MGGRLPGTMCFVPTVLQRRGRNDRVEYDIIGPDLPWRSSCRRAHRTISDIQNGEQVVERTHELRVIE